MALMIPALLRRLAPEWLLRGVRNLVWSMPNLHRRLQSGMEIVVANPADWVIYNDVFADGEYDEAIQAVLRSADDSRPIRVLDLGANVGYFALRFADLAMRSGAMDFEIVCVEASPSTARELERRLSGQRRIAGRVRLIRGLAGRRRGEGRLHESSLHFASSIRESSGSSARRLSYVDLAAATAQWPEIDLIKCDIEGAEQEVLEEYYQEVFTRAGRVVVELHHDLCDIDRCKGLLAAAGLRSLRELRAANGCSVVLAEREDTV